MSGPIEAAARALYECEKARDLHCAAVLSKAKGTPIKPMMEPWEECRECYLGDARAALEAAVDQMGWPEIHAYQAEMRRGQSIYEDAGGYFMRGLRRLFGLPQIDEEIITHQKAARAMIEAAQETK